MLLLLMLLTFGLLRPSLQDAANSFRMAKVLHIASEFNENQMGKLSSLKDDSHMKQVLDNICIPRVVGTPNHERVGQYIKSSLENFGWTIESDKFIDNTPLGDLEFENIIAKWNPNAKRYLVLACHYDSKYEKDFEFVGATDSAVPCMQLINLAKVMKVYLETIKNNDLSLMLLFLDGEEAFKQWSSTDSIYGARHLAGKWHNNSYSYKNDRNLSDLDKIDLFVLLDLIGAKDPKFYNYFENSSRWFKLLSKIEDILAAMQEFKDYRYGRWQDKYFQDFVAYARIEDDHIPFLEKDVPILHLIPYPFPDFWHTAGDNRNATSLSTIENINKVLRIFVASYLNIQVEGENDQSAEHLEL